MVKRFTLAVFCAASMSTTFAKVQVTEIDAQAPHISLHAYVGTGTTSECGLREVPHLIEHLVLSDTEYGANPVDAVLALRAKGIKLSAMTHSDFTEFSLEGLPSAAPEMVRALTMFLGRPSLSNMGFEREKMTITREMRSGNNYISSPTFYERFISVHSGAPAPCAADSKPFMAYTLDEVRSVFERMYVATNIRIVAVGQPGTFDLNTMVSAIGIRTAATTFSPQDWGREDAHTLRFEGREGLVEVIFPIAGRSTLPADAAEEMADQARLEVQTHIRRKHQLYTVRTFIDQSLIGGWIRLEVPELPQSDVFEIARIAKSAMSSVSVNGHWFDPIWVSLGSHLSKKPIGPPVIAEMAETGTGWFEQMWQGLLGLLARL